MAKAKKIRREIEIGGVKRWISGNTEQENAENLIQALRGETDNQAQFIPPPPRKDGGQQKRRMARPFLRKPSKTTKKPAISDWFLELMTGFEPVTSSLPRMHSTY